MTESYLTTDIIVIIVLVVVLVLIGVCAFFTHFYWTKIGVAEIWNTAKWSSMRSSFYHTMRRFSRASSKSGASERPFSAASAYSEDIDGTALPSILRNNNQTNNPVHLHMHSPPIQSTTPTKSSNINNNNNNVRRNSSNQIQPVSTQTYNNSARTNYGTKIGQPLENTKIHNIHEYDNPSLTTETHRF